MRNSNKALLRSAFFFVCTLVALNSRADPTVACPSPQNPQLVSVATVFDGDTLLLNDGRKVRLIGINTPELGRDGQPDQPLARQARSALRQLIQDQPSLQLQIGQQSHDRYNRLLAHLFLNDGTSVEAELIRQGLGFAISIPPNLALRGCLLQAEQQARQRQRGVWSEPYYRPQLASTLKRSSGGFGRYQGTITKVGSIKNGNSMELNGKIFVMLRSDGQRWLAQFSSDDLIGRQIEVRGWLINRKLTKTQSMRGFLPLLLKINHSDSLKLCHSDC